MAEFEYCRQLATRTRSKIVLLSTIPKSSNVKIKLKVEILKIHEIRFNHTYFKAFH